ncbi:MAG TPA: hypothetical protein VK171_15005 [Fimbriimonas sp.]|nr:hypothetical protein [Fimbriimonas sp.]
MSEFYARFSPDPEFPDERMMWVTDKPVLKDFVAEFAVYDPDFLSYRLPKGKPYPLEPSGTAAHIASDEVGVFLFEWSDEAAALQQAGWEYLIANAGVVDSALKQKLRSIQAKCLALHEEEIEGAGFLVKHWAKIQAQLRSGAEEAIDQFYKLVGISLAASGLDESCWIGFEFQTAWDKDHGLEVVVHKDKVYAAGGMTELLSPNFPVADSIRSVQEYELDPGDCKLD